MIAELAHLTLWTALYNTRRQGREVRGRQECRGRSPLPGSGVAPVFPPTIPLNDAEPHPVDFALTLEVML